MIRALVIVRIFVSSWYLVGDPGPGLRYTFHQTVGEYIALSPVVELVFYG